MSGAMVLMEVVKALAKHGRLRCIPSVAIEEDHGVVLRLALEAETQQDTGRALETLELFHELQYLQDLAQLRGLAARYDIDAGALERLLRKVEV